MGKKGVRWRLRQSDQIFDYVHYLCKEEIWEQVLGGKVCSGVVKRALDRLQGFQQQPCEINGMQSNIREILAGLKLLLMLTYELFKIHNNNNNKVI